MKVYRVTVRAAAVAAAVLTLAGCGKETPVASPAVAQPMVVKIGFAGPLTGPRANVGVDARNGAQFAVDRLNESGEEIGNRKVTFELVVVDDEATPSVAAAVARKLVDAKVVAVVGHINSGASIEASKVYSDAGIPQISPASTNPHYTKQGFKTTFRLVAADDLQAPVLVQFALDTGTRKIAVVDDATAYGKVLADAFAESARAAGAPIVARESVDLKSPAPRAVLARIQAARPDTVLFGGADVVAAPLLQRMRAAGIKARFMGGDGIKTPDFIALAGNKSEGVVVSSPGVPGDSLPGGALFAPAYRSRFKTEIQQFAPMAYDAVFVIAEAMRKAGTAEPARVLPALGNVQLAGVSGGIAFDARGDLRVAPVTLSSVNGGRWETAQIIMTDPGAGKK